MVQDQQSREKNMFTETKNRKLKISAKPPLIQQMPYKGNAEQNKAKKKK